MYRYIFIPTKVVWDGISQKTWIGWALDLQSKNAHNILQTYLNKLFHRNKAVSQSSSHFLPSPSAHNFAACFLRSIFGSRPGKFFDHSVTVECLLKRFSFSFFVDFIFPQQLLISFLENAPALAVAGHCVRVHISVCSRQRAEIMTSVVVCTRRGDGGVCVKWHADNIQQNDQITGWAKYYVEHRI